MVNSKRKKINRLKR